MEKTSLRITEKKIEGDSLTPILIFRRLQGRHRFLLESSSQHERSGRYSFIGVDPVKAYRGGNGRLEEFVYATGKSYVHEGDLYALLKRLMPRIAEHGKYPFMGGAVGYVGYGVARVDGIHSSDVRLPDVYFNIYDTVIIFDHLLNEVTLLHTEIHPEYSKPNLDTLAELITSGPIEEEGSVSLSEYRCALSREDI